MSCLYEWQQEVEEDDHHINLQNSENVMALGQFLLCGKIDQNVEPLHTI